LRELADPGYDWSLMLTTTFEIYTAFINHMKQWYTLHTKPNCERRVEQTLEQRGLSVYLPTIEVAQSHQNTLSRPFFPGYLFVHVNPERINWSQFQWTPGLNRIVAFGHEPAVVPDHVIDYIRRQLHQFNGANRQRHDSFQAGDEVRITDGPFQDLVAVFDRSLTPKGRVQVLLTVLGRASRVHLRADTLEKVVPKPKRPRRTRGRGRHVQ